MDRNIQILLVAGILVTLVVFTFSIYVAAIIFVIVFVIIMILMIMQDSTSIPADIVAELKEDAKAVVIWNTGNTTATKIHVALVPANIEFDLPSLAGEESYEYELGTMIENVKAVISFENEKGNTVSRSYRLSAVGDNFEPFKPVFPLFKWK